MSDLQARQGVKDWVVGARCYRPRPRWARGLGIRTVTSRIKEIKVACFLVSLVIGCAGSSFRSGTAYLGPEALILCCLVSAVCCILSTVLSSTDSSSESQSGTFVFTDNHLR